MISWELRGQPAFEELLLVFNEAYSFCLTVTSTFEHCVLKQVSLIFKLVTSNIFRGNCCFLFKRYNNSTFSDYPSLCTFLGGPKKR